MPQRDINVFKNLNGIFETLGVGDRIITNGDSGFAQDRYYIGTIKTISGNRIEISRDDRQEGGGEHGEWVIKNKAGSPIKLLILDVTVGLNTNRADIKFGDVISLNEELVVIMETLPHNKLLVRKFLRHETDNSTIIEGTGTFSRVLFHFDGMRCRECDSPAVISVNGGPYCASHLREYGRTLQCSECGQTMWYSASYTNGGDERYCDACYRAIREANRAINNYSFKPIPQFITVVPEPKELADKLFHGVENEVECGGVIQDDEAEWHEDEERGSNDREFLAAEVKKLANKKKKWIYIKSDGSLSNGFELVTEPATLAAHYTLPWDKICNFYSKNGIEADTTSTCGLHVHVNKNVIKEEAQIRLAYFVATQKKMLEKIARRPACNWAHFKDPNEGLSTIHKSNGKYEALNWTPPNTVEFRLFKGTVDYHTMMSSIEFTQAIILFTHGVSIEFLKNHADAWKAFVIFCNERKYKHLCNFMREKGVAA